MFDWAVTALFYSSLHAVQAFLAVRGLTPSNHVKRTAAMQNVEETRFILEPYLLLKNRSEAARYECQEYSRTQYEDFLTRLYEVILRSLRM